MLPTFIVIGAAKAGTTSLHAYLAAHPDVFVTRTKELDFFIEERNWERGRVWYEEQFDEADGAHARGEVSPLYSAAHWYAGVPDRMADLVPDARIVYVVRHPIDRMRSHYLQHLELGQETRPAARAFQVDDGYLNSSRYAFQLAAFERRFATEQFLVVTSEALRDDRRATLARVFAFLGVDADVPDAALGREHHVSEDKVVRPPRINALKRMPLYHALGRMTPRPVRELYGRVTTRPAGRDLTEIPAGLEAELAERLRPDVAALRRWLGPDFDGWGLV
jgi:hypothetical protein